MKPDAALVWTNDDDVTFFLKSSVKTFRKGVRTQAWDR